jgi:hypothetical protein
LRHILLTVKPKAQIDTDPEPKSTKSTPSHQPTKAKRRINAKDTQSPAADSTDPGAGYAGSNDQGSKDGGELERTASGSKEGSEEGSGVGGKKKTKKKKRSVLANQSNPHHVDNCMLFRVRPVQ